MPVRVPKPIRSHPPAQGRFRSASGRGNAGGVVAPRHEPRKERLAKLRRQLAELNTKGRQAAPGSPERDAVLQQWAPGPCPGAGPGGGAGGRGIAGHGFLSLRPSLR
jgi:hypothetical protein